MTIDSASKASKERFRRDSVIAAQKEMLVLKHEKLFPLLTNFIPVCIKAEVYEIYSKATTPELIINTLNNTYFKIVRKRSIRRSDEIGAAFEGKSDFDTNMLRLYGYRGRS
jgi:hypothetical protein